MSALQMKDVVTPKDVLPRYQSMATWRQRKRRKAGKGSQTPGKDKNGCSSSPLDRTIARRNRSWKHPKYPQWCEAKTGGKGSRKVN